MKPKIYPDIAALKEIAATGKYNVAPVAMEILSDFTTPIEVIRILKNISKHCYMLESAQASEHWGRYTFLGYDPKLAISCVDGKIEAGEFISLETDDPSEYLRSVLEKYKSPKLPDMPPFTGGLVGYFSFDYLSYYEPTTKNKSYDEEGFKDLDLMLFDKVIAFDSLKQKIILITVSW